MLDEGTLLTVSVRVSINGLHVVREDGRNAKLRLPLQSITRWTRQTNNVTIYYKAPGTDTETAACFYGPCTPLVTMVDMLTSCCFQCDS